MKQKIRWIVYTSVMLALLIALQWITKPLGQIVTGSCVNAMLALTALLFGIGSGITVASLSPVFAFALGIAPNPVVLPAIMLGNVAFSVLFCCIYGKSIWRRILAWLIAAGVKFAGMYLLVVVMICNWLSDTLTGAGILKPPMLTALCATFSWPQLVTALIGGALALVLVPALKRALPQH